MSLPIIHPDRKYTYEDYLSWPDEERYELLDGIPYAMTPAPSTAHQRISRELLTEFSLYLRGKKCEVFDAPFDVRFFAEDKRDKEVTHVVQPDIAIVCDPGKLDERGCKGSPDLIVEIISPATAKHDKWLKYKLYERAGVREYWIVDPGNKMVDVFRLGEKEKYELTGSFGKDDEIQVGIFGDLTIDLSVIFK